MKYPRLFQGVRLSTKEQMKLVKKMLADPTITEIHLGDTIVFQSGHQLMVTRLDWNYALTSKEVKARAGKK